MISAITQKFITRKDLSDSVMITWFGHSMFLLEDDREKLLFDPFHAEVGYGQPEVEADFVLVSHGHGDHNNVDMVKGRPAIINKPGSYREDNVDITGIQVYHDADRGAQRGLNIVFKVNMKGITFEHLGDLGHVPEGELADELSNPDVLFVPVGGVFTIDADTAAEVVRKLNPRVAIPMHYGTPAGKIPLGNEEPFINHFRNVERINEGPIYMKKEELPEPILILVMSYVT